MKIALLKQKGQTLHYLIERENGQYNNISESVTLTETETEGLTADEIKTLGFMKLKPLAKRVFEAIEPLDEPDNAVNFNIVESRTVKTEVFAPGEVIKDSQVTATKQLTDQYGQTTTEQVEIDTSKTGPVTVEGKTVNVIEQPAAQPNLEDYLIDLDFRLSKIELGV